MAIFNDESSINSIIGRGSTIRGDMKINGFMSIDGDLDGNLETTGNVIVGRNARINGNITAKSVTVGGIVKGNIVAPESVKLLSTCAVIGDVQTHSLQADENVTSWFPLQSKPSATTLFLAASNCSRPPFPPR